MALLVVAVLIGAGCAGTDDDLAAERPADDIPTTTEMTLDSPAMAPPSCPMDFEIPLESDRSSECRSWYMRSVADQEGIALTEEAETQAVALCREVGMMGIVRAMAAAFLAWDEGSRPAPSSDHGSFVPLAVGLYCPEHYGELRSLD